MIPVAAIAATLSALPLPDGPLVAALPMYDWPERRVEVDGEWAALRAALHACGIDAPEELARCNADLPPVPGGIRDVSGEVIAPDPATLPPHQFDLAVLWHHPSLLFAQTCWGPLEVWLRDNVQVVGQDDYTGIEGGEGELYSSAIVMRKGARSISGALMAQVFSGLRLAYNAADSMSGYLALERDLLAQSSSLDLFESRLISGGHRKSIRMVCEGVADVATVDCKTWALAQKYEPAARELAVVGWTSRRKGLPFITGRR